MPVLPGGGGLTRGVTLSRVVQLVTGRWWTGTAFGGYKSRTEVPKLVQAHLDRKLPVEHFITHEFNVRWRATALLARSVLCATSHSHPFMPQF